LEAKRWNKQLVNRTLRFSHKLFFLKGLMHASRVQAVLAGLRVSNEPYARRARAGEGIWHLAYGYYVGWIASRIA